MKYIGFTNKFYTLWDVYEDCKPLGNGRTMKVTKHIYIKNISFDRDKAFAAYPDAEFDENLRGHSSFDSNERIEWDNVDTFRFGKYMFMKIEEVNDIDYTEWYWNNIYDEHRDFVSAYLIKKGYEVRYWSDSNPYLVSPEVIENEKAHEVVINSVKNKLENHKELSFVPEYNPNKDGEIRDDDIIYVFSEVKENYYNGFTYYLPVLNGKQKRIKNKNVIVKDYTWEINNNDIIVKVKDFVISK